MKKIFTSLLLLGMMFFYSAFTYGQTPYTQKLDSIVSPTSKIVYQWDENGNIVSKNILARKSNTWVDSVRIECEWNTNNTLKSQINTYYSDNEISDCYKGVFKYDDYTTLITYNLINNEWIPTEKKISDIIQKQFPSSVIYEKNYTKIYKWEDNSWFETYEKIVNDGLTSTRSWSKDAEGNVSGSGQDYKLNVNSNEIYRVDYTYINGEFVPTYKYEVTDSDKIGNILSDIHYTYSDGEFLPTDKSIHSYYSNNKTKKIQIYQYIGKDWILTSEHEYDENGNMLLNWWKNYESSTITSGYKTIQEYDSQNNVTKSISYDWENGDWKELDTFLYDNNYDADSRLKEVDWKLKNASGEWATAMKDIYEYAYDYPFNSYTKTEYHSYYAGSLKCTNEITSKYKHIFHNKNEIASFEYNSSTSSWEGNECFTENISDGPTYDLYLWCNIGNAQIALYSQYHSENYGDESIWWNKRNAAGWCQPTSEMVLESYVHSKIYRDSNLTSEDVLCDYCGNIILYNASYNPDGDEIFRTTYYYSEFTPTDITSINAEHSKTDEIYNLNGQKISSSVKGIQIRNGKKHICN